MIADAPPVAAVEIPTCPRHGCGLLAIERHRDHEMTRLRAVFVCGFDDWSAPDGLWAPRTAGRPCTNCGEVMPDTEHRKCARCRVCQTCHADVDGARHTAAECPVPARRVRRGHRLYRDPVA